MLPDLRVVSRKKIKRCKQIELMQAYWSWWIRGYYNARLAKAGTGLIVQGLHGIGTDASRTSRQHSSFRSSSMFPWIFLQGLTHPWFVFFLLLFSFWLSVLPLLFIYSYSSQASSLSFNSIYSCSSSCLHQLIYCELYLVTRIL